MKQIYVYKTILDNIGKIHKQLIGVYNTIDDIPENIIQNSDLIIESNDHGESAYRGANL